MLRFAQHDSAIFSHLLMSFPGNGRLPPSDRLKPLPWRKSPRALVRSISAMPDGGAPSGRRYGPSWATRCEAASSSAEGKTSRSLRREGPYLPTPKSGTSTPTVPRHWPTTRAAKQSRCVILGRDFPSRTAFFPSPSKPLCRRFGGLIRCSSNCQILNSGFPRLPGGATLKAGFLYTAGLACDLAERRPFSPLRGAPRRCLPRSEPREPALQH